MFLRNILPVVGLVFACGLYAQSSSVVQAEWFIGLDPGQGLANAMDVVDGAWDEALEEVIASIPATPLGDVVLSVRVKGANGSWSGVFRNVVRANGSITVLSVHVQAGEYFWDDDPGEGNGSPLLAFDGDFDGALEEAMAVDNTITPGAHRLFVRMKGADEHWSATFTQVVHIDIPIVARSINLLQGEFFFDGDPGEGNATPLLAFDGDWNGALEQGMASSSSLEEGGHVLYVRVRGGDGGWSNEYKTIVHVGPELAARLVSIQAAEYFWGDDPGEGAGLPMLAFDGDFNGALEQAEIASNGATLGDNLLSVRKRGADGSWSMAFRSVVHVAPPIALRDVRIVFGEYFFDNDPGEGNATALTVLNGAWDEAVEGALAETGTPSIGDHVLHVRMQGAGGEWSDAYRTVMHVDAPLSERPVMVLAGEYYWDADPGAGSGLPLFATDSSFDAMLEEMQRSLSDELTAGPHVCGVRTLGMDGNWSAAFRQVVQVNAPVLENLPISLGIFLQGPLTSATNMSDALRSAGMVPLVEPFTGLGYTHVGSGGETIDPWILQSGPFGNVVDWVFVELRDKADPSHIVQTRCGLLRQNGSVSGHNGFGDIIFNAPQGDYHVSVRHRNHLGVMTAVPIALGSTGAMLDLRLPGTPTHGTEARVPLFGRSALWSGDVNADGAVIYTGQDNDRDPILQAIGGVVPTNTVGPDYRSEDVNMDGIVKYTGAGNDRDVILQNIGGVVPTNTRGAQLP